MNRLQAITLSLSAGALLAACSSTGDGQQADSPEAAALTGAGPDGAVHWLFVQGAEAGTFDGTRLTLENPAPTVFFSDRPMRVDGHMATERFVGAWDAGSDSFASDPPNAVVSLLGGDEPQTAVVVLRNPSLADGVLSFDADVSQGQVPETFGQASLFIDSMGLAGPTLGLGMNQAAQGAMFQPRMDLAGPDAYYRTFQPGVEDPLNPNLVPREDRGQGYKWAYDLDGPPKMELGPTKMGLTPYYGD